MALRMITGTNHLVLDKQSPWLHRPRAAMPEGFVQSLIAIMGRANPNPLASRRFDFKLRDRRAAGDTKPRPDFA